MVGGIDFGATLIRGALIAEKGQVIGERTENSKVGEGREATLARLIKFSQTLIDNQRVGAVGVGTPGPIDYLTGVVLNPPNLPNWQNVPLRDILKDALGVPIMVDRDANCALLGEMWQGEARGVKNAVLITWGTGVGGAVLINGEIERGQSNLAGEIGHMIIDKDGPACPLGHRGCLESLIGGAAVERAWGKDLATIMEGARAGRDQDQKIATKIGDTLQIGLKNLVTLYDPEVIIFDGSVVKSIDIFLPKIQDFPIKVSQLALRAGVIGAGKLALDYLNSRNLNVKS